MENHFLKNLIEKKKKHGIIATMILAGMIAIAPISAGCDITKNPDGTITIDPSKPVDPDKPMDPVIPEKELIIDYSQYSQALQNVLGKKEYYTNIVKNPGYSWTYYMPIPYKFLEDEGFDIQKIKDGQLKIGCSSHYLDGNDLHFLLNVQKDEENTYYDSYEIVYTLENKEVKELYKLTEIRVSGQRPEYAQTYFMLQEISYLKTPKVISHYGIDIEKYVKPYKWNLGYYFFRDIDSSTISFNQWEGMYRYYDNDFTYQGLHLAGDQQWGEPGDYEFKFKVMSSGFLKIKGELALLPYGRYTIKVGELKFTHTFGDEINKNAYKNFVNKNEFILDYDYMFTTSGAWLTVPQQAYDDCEATLKDCTVFRGSVSDIFLDQYSFLWEENTVGYTK